MAIRPKELYRGRHKRRVFMIWPIAIFLLLAVTAIVLFYSLQKYLVYGQDGLSLEIPFMSSYGANADSSGSSDSSAEEVYGDIVIDAPVYENVDTNAGEGLSALKAVYVSQADITDTGLAAAKSKLTELGANALVLDMKPAGGGLSWASGAALASSFGTSGTTDITAFASSLKSENIYLVAEVSCCVDDLMAARNSPVALKDSSGALYSDSAGSWIDPYNPEVRKYISELLRELAEAGFDELLLTNVAYPSSGEPVVFSQKLSYAPTPKSSVSSFALNITKSLSDLSVRISVLCDTQSLRSGLSEQTGQDPAFFSGIFSRLYFVTDADYLGSDSSLVAAALGSDSAHRAVPVLESDVSPVSDSWIVK